MNLPTAVFISEAEPLQFLDRFEIKSKKKSKHNFIHICEGNIFWPEKGFSSVIEFVFWPFDVVESRVGVIVVAVVDDDIVVAVVVGVFLLLLMIMLLLVLLVLLLVVL